MLRLLRRLFARRRLGKGPPWSNLGARLVGVHIGSTTSTARRGGNFV